MLHHAKTLNDTKNATKKAHERAMTRLLLREEAPILRGGRGLARCRF
jgi:hypothetical protein